MGANELPECVHLTDFMDLKQEIRDFSYGTSTLINFLDHWVITHPFFIQLGI